MWNYDKMLEEMEQRMFAPDMCRHMIDTPEYIPDPEEESYQEAKTALSKQLSKETLKLLNETEEEGMRFLLYCIALAFKRGIYTGFEHVFSPSPEPKDFEKRIVKEFIELPKMEKHTEYYERHINLQNMFTRLIEIADKCDDETYENMKTIDSVWDEREYTAFRYGYYMGYRYALSLTNEVDPNFKYTAAVFVTLFSENTPNCFNEKILLMDKFIAAYDNKVQARKALTDFMQLI